MQLFLETLLVFISTEIDDFIVFSLLFVLHRNAKGRFLIFLGRLSAVILVCAFSSFASFLLFKVPHSFLRYLGFIPLLMGVITVIKNLKNKGEDSAERNRLPSVKEGAGVSLLVSAFMLTLSSSGDNLGIYIPFFLDFNLLQKVLSILFISVLNIFWTILQIKTADIELVQTLVSKAGKILVPAVFFILGLSILMTF